MKFNRILATVLTCLMVLGAVFIGLQGKPVSRDDSLYITDAADVISQRAELEFAALQRELTPRLSVAIVNSTGKMSTAEYCETLWNNWHLGTSDMLLLMVTGKEDYYFGYDYSSSFADELDANFDLLMERYLEPDFAVGDYDKALFSFSDGIQTLLSGAYFDNGLLNGGEYYGEYSAGISGMGLVIVILFVVIFIAVVAAGSIGKKRPGSTVVYHKPSTPGTFRPTITVHRPTTTVRPGSSFRPTTTVRPSSSRPSRPGGFGGSGRSSGGFGGGSRSTGGRSGGFGGGGRSGGMGGRGRR